MAGNGRQCTEVCGTWHLEIDWGYAKQLEIVGGDRSTPRLWLGDADHTAETALAAWEVQAHRTLAANPDPADLVRVARMQALIASTTSILTEAAVRTGHIHIDGDLLQRLAPALDADHVAVRDHKAEHMKMRREADESWNELGLVFCTRRGSALDAANVRRSFRLVASAAGLNPKEWTPRELRHSFVSLLSSSGVTIEEIAHLVGHGSTSVTERVYRKELRPVITRGARAINELFDGDAKR